MNSKNHLNNFTVNINEQTEKHIFKDINNIKEILLKSNINILGIYLVGGFGRGEGSTLIKKNKVYIINDYDLIVVYKNSINSKEKNDIIKKLKKKVSIRQIDITYYEFKTLRKLKNSVYNYDFKYHSKIIYQNKNYIKFIPEFNKEFNISEAYLPLEVYMSALILSLPTKNDFNNLNKSKRFWVFHQISKSIIGWSLSDMIENNLYEPLYSNRFKVLKKLYFKSNDKHKKTELVKLALDFKLNTYYDINLELDKLWFQTKKIHMDALIQKYFIIYKINIPFYFYKLKIKNIAKFLYGFAFNKKYYYEYSNLFLSKLFFLLSIDGKNVDKNYFKSCIKYCKKIGLSNKHEYNFDNILEFLKKKDPNCIQFLESTEDILHE